MQNFTGYRAVRLTKCRQRAILKQQMQGTGKVARAVRPRECGTAESRARAPRERTPGSSKLNTAACLPLSRCAAGPALQGQRLNKERVSDRTSPVIQVAPRTLQDSLFALNFQGKSCLFIFWSCLRDAPGSPQAGKKSAS